MTVIIYVTVALSVFSTTMASPVRTTNGQDEKTTGAPRQTPPIFSESQYEFAVDSRLVKRTEESLGPYQCTDDSQCSAKGNCVSVGESGKLCNCTKGYLGSFCDYQATAVEKAIKHHHHFKVSFAECLTKSGSSAQIDPIDLLGKCGGGQNLCWYKQGGAKALKCFFWGLTNTMMLSITEDKQNDEARMRMYEELVQKFARERQLPPGEEQQRPRGIPVASLQINLYNIPNPEANNNENNRGPQISIIPTWTYWTTDNSQTEKPQPSPRPSKPYIESSGDSNNAFVSTTTAASTTKTVKSTQPVVDGDDSTTTTASTTRSAESALPVVGDNYSPFDGQSSDNGWFEYPNGASAGGTGLDSVIESDDFLNETLHEQMVVVEAGDGTEDVEAYMYPVFDLDSNMRGG